MGQLSHPPTLDSLLCTSASSLSASESSLRMEDEVTQVPEPKSKLDCVTMDQVVVTANAENPLKRNGAGMTRVKSIGGYTIATLLVDEIRPWMNKLGCSEIESTRNKSKTFLCEILVQAKANHIQFGTVTNPSVVKKKGREEQEIKEGGEAGRYGNSK